MVFYKITNQCEFENVCSRRGWNSDAYAKEVQEHAMTAGDFGKFDMYGDYTTKSGRTVSERFSLVRPAVVKIENEETGARKTWRECDEIPAGWFWVYEISPAAYRFEKNDEVTRYIIEEKKRRARR